MNIRKVNSLICSAVVFTSLLAGCNNSKDSDSKSSVSSESALSSSSSTSNSDESSSSDSSESSTVNSEQLSTNSSDYSIDVSSVFSDRDISGEYDSVSAEISFNGTSITADGDGAQVSGTTVKITKEGTYLFNGTLDDGNIIVEAADTDKVQLIFNNVTLSCSTTAPVYVVNADKVFITNAAGSTNTLSDGTAYVYENAEDNEPDAVIYSCDDLTVNGNGTLNIDANFNEGITSKNDLVIANCTVNIDAVGNGIKGKDSVAVTSAKINVTAGEDGIKSTNIEEAQKGFIYFQSGDVKIVSAEDGIQAETELIVSGGSFDINAGGGSSQGEAHTGGNDFGGGFGRGGNFETTTDTETETDTTVSKKGIKCSSNITISGGTLKIDSADDSVHSGVAVNILGGTLTINSGDDGIHADSEVNISGGTVNIESSYEAVEGAAITISGGTVKAYASDDGFNASDGTAQGAMGTNSAGASLTISGGDVYVNADGDGLDSNGSITISGGTIKVDGPTNDGNGAIDGNGSVDVSGGLLIAAGSSGMAVAPDTTSAQNSVVITLTSYLEAGTKVFVCDSDGNEVVSFEPAKTFNSVIFSSPDFKSGETYTVKTGDTTEGTFTVESSVSYVGTFSGMGGGNMGGGFGGGKGNFSGEGMPEGEIPEMPNGEAPEMPEGGFGGAAPQFNSSYTNSANVY